MITFDDSLWPLLTVNFVGASSAQDFDTYITKMTEYLQRGDKYLTILDTRGQTTGPTLEQRQRQIDWIRQNTALLKQRSIGTAFVITSPFIRLALSIMYQLQPPPTHYTVVGDIKVAQSWALARFQASGLPSPSRLTGKQGTSSGGPAWQG